MKRMSLLPIATALSTLVALPASAQEQGGERVMMVTIEAGQACPESPDPDTIVVCEEMDPGEQYRIPSNLRQGRSPENRSWTERVRDNENVGNFGPGSCTNIGGGSELGCTAQMIEDAYAEREQAPERRFSEQIAAARAERLETIDADAARTQARVEEIEREYMQRLEAERDGPLPGEEDETLPAPQVADPAAIPQRPPANPS